MLQPDDIAREILSQVKTTIVLNMRFMDMAVFRLRAVPEKTTLATDGDRLYYDPVWLLKRYRGESNAVTRDYLHVLLHCIFRHPFVHSLIDAPLWDLACDIAAEKMICDFGNKYFSIRDEVRRQSVISSLENKVHPLTAERLYHYFQDHKPDPGWATLFRADDHELWHNPGKARRTADSAAPDLRNNPSSDKTAKGKKPGKGESEDRDGRQKPDNGQENPEDNASCGTEPYKASVQNSAGSPLEDEWRDISDHIQMDLESFGKQRGENAGSMQQLLAQINREKYDYEAFLKKFAVMGEVMKINDDEFDYIFYTYGLKLYRNMPLIEPLEYKEVKRIREFVIAIDTSGSTSGDLVQRFLTKTWNILQSTESFFSRVNIHIIQCDASIQEAVKITTKDEFEEYIRHMRILGFGGTDFRPVFTYVEQMIQQKEFRNLKGLIYFTDGYGTFPKKMPDYQTAFVFVQDKYNNVNVPPWAMKLILENNEI